MEYEDTTRISTPEGVELELRLAGLGSRFSAELIDILIKGVLLGALALLAFLALGGVAATVVFTVGVFAAVVVYDVVFEVRSAGATPGKRALGTRVLLEDGSPVGLRASAIRNVIRLIEGFALLYIPAIIAVLATRRNQRLGDLAAGTVVARATQEGGPAFRRLPAAGEYADWDVSAVTQEELAAVRSFLGRRFGFEPAVRYQLAATLAAKLGPKVSGGPPYDQQPERFLEQLESAKSARL
jgi:uncharacterized RDD family membrane protein YckC